jgi:hypothetical protein
VAGSQYVARGNEISASSAFLSESQFCYALGLHCVGNLFIECGISATLSGGAWDPIDLKPFPTASWERPNRCRLKFYFLCLLAGEFVFSASFRTKPKHLKLYFTLGAAVSLRDNGKLDFNRPDFKLYCLADPSFNGSDDLGPQRSYDVPEWQHVLRQPLSP